MPTYTFPDEWLHRYVESSRFMLRPFSLSSQPLYGGARRAYGPLKHVWTCDLKFHEVGEDDWRRMQAFFSRLDGMAGTVRLFDPDRQWPLGSGAGLSRATFPNPGTRQALSQPTTTRWSDGTAFTDGTAWLGGSRYATVLGASSAGSTTLTLTGLIASSTIALAAGDLLELGSDLYEVSADVASSAAGAATVEVRPRLRRDVPNGSQVSFGRPRGTFMLSDDGQGVVERGHQGFGVRHYKTGTLGASFIEVVT